MECGVSNALNAVAEHYARKIFALIEREGANARYAVGNSYALKSATGLESRLTNALNAFGNVYIYKGGTSVEGKSSYARYCIGDDNACNIGVTAKRGMSYSRDLIAVGRGFGNYDNCILAIANSADIAGSVAVRDKLQTFRRTEIHGYKFRIVNNIRL